MLRQTIQKLFPKSGSRRRLRRSRRYHFIEALERRVVLSGLVVSGSNIAYQGSVGEVNTLTVTETGNILTFTDTTAIITPGAGPFTVISPNQVQVDVAGFSSLQFSLSDMDDSLDVSAVTTASGLTSTSIYGGEGSDVIIGSQLRDVITLNGIPGSDTIDAQGGGSDLLSVGVDLDMIMTDSTLLLGSDLSSYANFESISLNGGASANIIDASAVTTSSGFDGISINGGAGDDTIIGSQLRDVILLTGNPGADVIDGQSSQPGQSDFLSVGVDMDITMTNSTLLLGSDLTTYTNIEFAALNGGNGNNIIDASGVTTASGLSSLVFNGGAGNDTIIGSQLRDSFQLRGNPGADIIDGQSSPTGERDFLTVQLDVDQTLTNTTLLLGGDLHSHVNLEEIRLFGGAGDNVFDLTGASAGGSLHSIIVTGANGSDTIAVADLNLDYDIDGRAGADTLDLSAANLTPNITGITNGTIDGQRGQFAGISQFDNIDQIVLPPEYDFIASSYGVPEGDATNTVTVVELTRSVNTSIASSVDVVLTGNTATAGSDFTDGPITVNFAPGEVSKSVPIEILGDTAVESDETIDLSLANGIPGPVQAIATLTIQNDDVANQPPEFLTAETDATFSEKANVGDSVTLTATFSDPDANDSHTAVIDWGDGTTSVGVVDSQSGVISGIHQYVTGGVFEVSVSLTDAASETDDIPTSAVVTGVRLTDGGELQVIGSDHRDHVSIREGRGRHSGLIKVRTHQHHGHWPWQHTSNHTLNTFPIGSVTSILVYTCEGRDHVNIHSSIDVGATVYAGAGNDHVHGGSGNDTIFGGSGSDWLGGNNGDDIILGGSGWDYLGGGRGRDLLIGGTGRDFLNGRGGQDLLIGASTSHDADVAALNSIMAEWASVSPFSVRVANLSGGLLAASQIIDDGVRDWLHGGQDHDWYFADISGPDFDWLTGLNLNHDELTGI